MKTPPLTLSISKDSVLTAVALAAAIAGAWLTAVTDAPPGTKASLVLVILVSGVLILVRHRLATWDWFHPTVFPLLYISIALTAPTAYLVVTNRPLEALPSEVTASVVAVFALAILGLVAGLVVGLHAPRASRTGVRRPIDFERARRVGRVFLVMATIPQLVSVIRSAGEQYGTGAVDFGLEQTIMNLAVFLFFAGTVLTTTANAELGGRIATRTDLALFLPFVGLAVLSGGRDEFLPPLLFAIWAQHTLVKRIPGTHVALAIVTITIVFQAVAGVRAGEAILAGPHAAIERTLVAIGTPTHDVGEIVRRVPRPHGYEMGSTYLAGLERQLPAPVANAIFGTPDDTGAYVFRRLLGFSDPNAGFGFSLPAEGYLNFGFAGSFVSAMILGSILGFAFRRQAIPPERALHLLYPIMVSTLPLAVRSDALGQIKWILYPSLMLALVLHLSQRAKPISARFARSSDNAHVASRPGRAAAIALAAVCLAGLAVAAAARQKGFIEGAPTRAALAEVTGIALHQSSPNSTGAVNVLATYVGGTADESIVLIVCASETDAAKISAAPRGAGPIRVARQRNLVVIYQRVRQVENRWAAIRAALRGAPEKS